jgi:universal stress protein E
MSNPRARSILLEDILVGVDWLDPCQAAVSRAVNLPLAIDARVTLFHVIHRELGLSPLLQSLAEQDAPRLLEEAAERARQLASDLGASVRVETAFCNGLPFIEVVREARARSADLIVVGRHSKRSLSEALIGTTAERVFRKTGTAVLIVGEPTGPTRPILPYRRALVAVDMSETCRRAVALGLRVLDASVETVDIVHAVEAVEHVVAAKEAVTAMLAATSSAKRWNLAVEVGDPRKVILDVASHRGCELVVLGTHGRTALAQMLVGSVAEAVVRNARCDVLVAHQAEQRFELP